MGRPTAIAVLILASATTAHAACAPTAIAEGDPALVADLATRLIANGIATARTGDCPVVMVRVEQRGEQLHLRLADPFQRRGERDVRDVATAAAIVASWTMQVIDEGSLPEVHVEVPPPPLPPVASRPWTIGASIGSALASNTATWLGGGLAGCVRVGPLCAGAAALAMVDTRATGDTAAVLVDSWTVIGLATLDLPVPLGALTLTPGLGVGYGYQHLVAHHMDTAHNPLDVPQRDHALRGMIHAALGYALSARTVVFLDLAGGAALVRSDSTAGPAGAGWLALGLRYEVP
ncbi:MAG: hypothetical protein ABI678_04150 [Kofleriaceae bacterium]